MSRKLADREAWFEGEVKKKPVTSIIDLRKASGLDDAILATLLSNLQRSPHYKHSLKTFHQNSIVVFLEGPIDAETAFNMLKEFERILKS